VTLETAAVLQGRQTKGSETPNHVFTQQIHAAHRVLRGGYLVWLEPNTVTV